MKRKTCAASIGTDPNHSWKSVSALKAMGTANRQNTIEVNNKLVFSALCISVRLPCAYCLVTEGAKAVCTGPVNPTRAPDTVLATLVEVL